MQEPTSTGTMQKQQTEDVRAELYRILEELGTARADRAETLRARFDELWDELTPEQQDTVH